MKSKRDDEWPNSEGWDMNGECTIGNIMDRRNCARMTEDDITTLFDVKEILVAIATDKKTFIGSLVNISAGGVSVKLSALVAINIPLCISFFMGKKNIIVKSEVKHICKKGDNYITGIIFADLDQESLEYIDGIICINALLKDMGGLSIQKIAFCCTSQHPYFRKPLNDHGAQSNA